MPWYGHWISSSPSSLAHGERGQPVPAGVGERHGPAVLGAVEGERPVRDPRGHIGFRVTSWSQAATYQALSGYPSTLLVVELTDCIIAVMSFLRYIYLHR